MFRVKLVVREGTRELWRLMADVYSFVFSAVVVIVPVGFDMGNSHFQNQGMEGKGIQTW